MTLARAKCLFVVCLVIFYVFLFSAHLPYNSYFARAKFGRITYIQCTYFTNKFTNINSRVVDKALFVPLGLYLMVIRLVIDRLLTYSNIFIFHIWTILCEVFTNHLSRHSNANDVYVRISWIRNHVHVRKTHVYSMCFLSLSLFLAIMDIWYRILLSYSQLSSYDSHVKALRINCYWSCVCNESEI